MKSSALSIILTVIAIAVGLVVLLGYFISIPGLGLDALRTTLLGWAIILAAIASWVGIGNLLTVHWNKINNGQSGYGYSVVLIFFFLVTLVVGILSYLSPENNLLLPIVKAIQFPVEASLMAILTAVLAFAAIRLLRRRRTFFAIVFFVSALVFLALGSGLISWIGGVLFPTNPDLTRVLVGVLDRMPMAGARGILLGVALGSLATGLRILMGADRPYGS
ncbi:MAG TPA: hypothetical protein VMT46_09130 [Anaerolineaceae bacterium]|nr:hypothetical protein [Anaerolineaceae bacterium]